MKAQLTTILIGLLLVAQAGFCQHYQYPESGSLMSFPRWEGSGLPDGYVSPKPSGEVIDRGSVYFGGEVSSKTRPSKASDPDAFVPQEGYISSGQGKTTQGAIVSVGRKFVANNLANFTPCDNAMAISDDGFIVSADNFTIEYYTDNTDSLVQNQTYDVFYNDTTLAGVPFDPRIIYDAYTERFFLITLAYADSAANKILLSVSKGQDPRNGWYHYQINSDTLSNDQWFDFANIGMNKNEFFISGNKFLDAGNVFAGVKIFQIRKRELLTGLRMTCRVWANVLDDDGNNAYTVVPLSDALMSESYKRGIYMVSTKLVSTGQSSSKLFWYQITDSLDAAGVTIMTNQSVSSVAYSPQNVALQFGSNDQIRISDCKVQSGFYLDSVLTFVYTKNTNNYSTIALHQLDTRTNTNTRFPWGFSSGFQDYCFPSIAFWGADSTDSDNVLMTFQRTGPSIFPELTVINFQGGAFATNATLVRMGDGFIDLDPTVGASERWGDYTTTQRRYGAAQKTCWLAGSYPNGANANFYGVSNGLNTFVAEIRDSVAVAVLPLKPQAQQFQVFPNPSSGKVFVTTHEKRNPIIEVTVFNQSGAEVLKNGKIESQNFNFSLEGYPKGIYLAMFKFKNNEYETKKIVIH